MKRFLAFTFLLCTLMALTGCAGQVDPYAVTLAAADDDYTPSTPTVPTEISFTRKVVCEDDAYNITIRSINPNSQAGYILSLNITNNKELIETVKTEYIYKVDDDGEKIIVGEEQVTTYTGETYLFVVDSVVANGKEIQVDFSVELGAEDSTVDQIVLPAEALEGLGPVTEIQLTFKVYEENEENEKMSTISTVIYPYGNLESMPN